MDVFLAGGRTGKQDIYYVDHVEDVDVENNVTFPTLNISAGQTPKLLSLFKLKRIEYDYDIVLSKLAKVILLQETDDWIHKFEELDWERVENSGREDSLELSSALSGIFDVSIPESKITILRSSFRSNNGFFDVEQFLGQLFKHIELQRLLMRNSSGLTKMNIERLRSVGRMVGLVKVRVAATMKENALQRALAMVVQAVRMKVEYNEDVSTTSYRMGGLDLNGLRSEIKRVLNVSLTELQTEALFEILDLDNNGAIDRYEFSTFFNGVAEDARKDKQLKKERQKHRAEGSVTRSSGSSAKLSRPTSSAKLTDNLSAVTGPTNPDTFQSLDFVTALSKLRSYAEARRELSLPEDWMTSDTMRSLLKTESGIILSRSDMSAIALHLGKSSQIPHVTTSSKSSSSSSSKRNEPSLTSSPLSSRPQQQQDDVNLARRSSASTSRKLSAVKSGRRGTIAASRSITPACTSPDTSPSIGGLSPLLPLKQWELLDLPENLHARRTSTASIPTPSLLTTSPARATSQSSAQPTLSTRQPLVTYSEEQRQSLTLVSGRQFIELYSSLIS